MAVVDKEVLVVAVNMLVVLPVAVVAPVAIVSWTGISVACVHGGDSNTYACYSNTNGGAGGSGGRGAGYGQALANGSGGSGGGTGAQVQVVQAETERPLVRLVQLVRQELCGNRTAADLLVLVVERLGEL